MKRIQMMDLEESLGKQLLIRGKKKVTLTENGAYLRNRAQEIISLMESTESAFRGGEHTITGDVFIGGGEHRSSYPIMQMIHSIQEEHPDIHFHFFSGNADALRKLGVLMRKDPPFANQESITFEELSALPVIMPSQTSNSNRIATFWPNAMTSPHVVASYNLIYNAGLIVEAGMGYALCIDDLINTEGAHPLTFVPLAPALQSNVYLFTKK